MDFERASSGLIGLDNVIDHLWLGDNVVWQVDSVDDYCYFAHPFANEAIKTGKRLVYLRFGGHPPIFSSREGIGFYELKAERGFEQFSSEIREIATEEGEGVYYVFDCLSELLSEWSTDLMIGNFFLVTCPYLFKLKTIAYFGILRNCHSYQTIARIRDTTQLLLDVYLKDRYYVHPLKVWKRYSPTMFLPHAMVENDFLPLTNSADVAQLFSSYLQQLGDAKRKLDYWDHIFIDAADLTSQTTTAGDQILFELRQTTLEQLLRMIISRDEKILALARQYLTIEDLLGIKSRLIGSGLIGGKSVGLLLSRGIIARKKPGWQNLLEPHDSFYIGSDVFYTYLVENDCWQLRQEQKKLENYFSAAVLLREKIACGRFPEIIREQFLEMLEYFGQSPIIVRSSSLLEDSFGNAFAGKYESVFCVNQGDLSERYRQFIQAVQKIYASTMNENALSYRLQRGLIHNDEQMALLVQRVSGKYRNSYFFPDLAGVALSYNLYIWYENMDPTAGMLRLVLGLGTRAVERSDNDYAKLIALDHPLRRPDSDPEDQITFTQHNVDLLDLTKNAFETSSFYKLVQQNLIEHLSTFAVCDPRKFEEPEMRWFLNFESLLSKTTFPKIMREMLHTLQTAYGYPVDTEFTVNFKPDGNYSINLLQCRPLQTKCNLIHVSIPQDIQTEQVILSTRGRFLGGSLKLKVSRIIFISPENYALLPLNDKYRIARLIGQLNQLTISQEKIPTMLLGPGRWGTSTPSLGVPVSFAEINRFAILGEVAFETAGFVPELSYGTHFFHDLVETDIFYLVVNEKATDIKFNREFFTKNSNSLIKLLPDAKRWKDVVYVFEQSNLSNEILFYADVTQQKILCWQNPTK
jgi:hypothetical protein